MIKGVHTMFYSDEPEALRDFLRDKLGFPATDVSDGWLIFDLPSADLGVHPTDSGSAPHGTHDISFYTDDIETPWRNCRPREWNSPGRSRITATPS